MNRPSKIHTVQNDKKNWKAKEKNIHENISQKKKKNIQTIYENESEKNG